MSASRSRHDPAFKAKIAFTALHGDATVAEPRARFGVHPHQNLRLGEGADKLEAPRGFAGPSGPGRRAQ